MARFTLCVLTLMGTLGLPAPAAEGADSTEIVLLGTLHDGHQKNARYSVAVLRDLIVKLKPAAILIELPPAIGGLASLEKERIAGRFAGNENDSANAAPAALRIPLGKYDRRAILNA